MRRLFVFVLFALITTGAYAQESCCSPSEKQDKATTSGKTTGDAIASFASNADDPNFVAAHLAPKPVTVVNGRGAMIELTLSDRTKSNAYFVRANSKSNKWLIVFHEWWGLNDYIKNEAEKYAEAFPNLNVLALDLYDGQVTGSPDTAAMLIKGVKTDRSMKIIEAAKKHVGANAEVGTLGWCFGGGMSMQAAIIFGKQAKACILYYGMPEMDSKKLKNLTAPVLGIFAEKDTWINREVINEFVKAFRPLKRKYEIKWFEAAHAFANPSNPEHNSAMALEAEELSMKFLKTHLMGKK
ncbi:hypothetical protein MASR1M107_08570 [Ignavibacteriales bacterium]